MPEPRPEILDTPFEPHGGPDGSGAALLDFSVNSNPFGPPRELLNLIREADYSCYPDPTGRQPREVIAAYHGTTTERLTLGNGTAELIHRLAACYLSPGRRVVVAEPTFGEYARASALYGAEVVRVHGYGKAQTPDHLLLLDAIRATRPTLVWLCQPNNPTGHAWAPSQLESLALACRQNDSLLVLDVAYYEMSDLPSAGFPAESLCLWSLTKSFCIPGLRVGYASGPGDVIANLERTAAPWQVSSPAQLAAGWSRSQAGRSFLARTIPELLSSSRTLREELEGLGYLTEAGTTPFFLVDVGDAAAFTLHARAAGFRVRDTSSFGLTRHVRLAPQRPDANARLVAWMGREHRG